MKTTRILGANVYLTCGKQVNATCIGMQTTVSVCAKNSKEAQAMVDVSAERTNICQSEQGGKHGGEVWANKAYKRMHAL